MIALATSDSGELRLEPHQGCTTCFAQDFCGGEALATCRCVRPSLIHTCEKCRLMCRERDTFTDAGRALESAARQALLVDGLPLRDLVPKAGGFEEMPLLIPMQTFQLPEGHVLEDTWVGVDLRRLKRQAKDLRTFARASDEAQLLGVLNTKDRDLEILWGMGPQKRQAFFNSLVEQGLRHLTGPTFSVYSNDIAMERLSQLHRHHRVVDEAQRAGLWVAPNLYVHNMEGFRQWVRWLQDHPEVRVVSREVSFLRGDARHKGLAHVRDLLDASGRTYHLILTGIGHAHTEQVIRHFAASNHTVSIATYDPILAGVRGGRVLGDRGPVRRRQSVGSKARRELLALENLERERLRMRELASRLGLT